MDYILEFKKFKNKNILFLHGLDGDLNKNYKSILNKLGLNYIGLSLDYRNDNIWDVISEMDIDGVIGHSLGGYIAYYLSNYKKIPALLLMPSFDKEDIKLQSIPQNIKKLSNYKDKIALVGLKDDAVNLDLQEENLEGIKIYKENIGHDITDKIFEKYVKTYSKFLL